MVAAAPPALTKPLLAGICFRPHVVLDPTQHVEEMIPIEFEPSHVLFYRLGDLIDRHEERQLTFSQSVEQLILIMGHPKDRLPVRDELDLGEVTIQFGGPSQVVPRPAHPLDRHTVVEQALDNTQGHQVPK